MKDGLSRFEATLDEHQRSPENLKKEPDSGKTDRSSSYRKEDNNEFIRLENSVNTSPETTQTPDNEKTNEHITSNEDDPQSQPRTPESKTPDQEHISVNPSTNSEETQTQISNQDPDTLESPPRRLAHCRRIYQEIRSMFALIRKKRLSMLLVSNTSFKLAPSFRSSFDYFLLHIMRFTNKEFAVQKILDSVFFFLGILLLNSVFQKLNKKKFLRFNAVSYSVLICVLVGVVELVFKFPKKDLFGLILVYSSLHSLFFEMLFIPIAGTEFCICICEVEL